MTLRFRRTMKIAPGVHLNFNKNSLSLSMGPHGAHYTMSTSGRRTISAGLTGTGLYAYQTTNPRVAARKAAMKASKEPQDVDQLDSPAPTPSRFASKAEKSFYAFLMDIFDVDHTYTPHQIVEKAKALQEQYDVLSHGLNLIAFLYILNDDEYQDKLIEMGTNLWSIRETIFSDPLVVTYFAGIHPNTGICQGITSSAIFNKQQFGFVWVEVLQAHEKYAEALEVLHAMEPTQLVAVSMADVELSMKDYEAVLATTSDITIDDDATLILLVFRGIAFREQSLYVASLECMKEALAVRGRSKEALHRAHFERSITYEKMGNLAQAKKDLQLILVDDSSNEEVLVRLKTLENDQGSQQTRS